MSKQHIITKFRFLEFGKNAPTGSRFKGKISAASLIGWLDYTKRDSAADSKKDKTMHKGGLLGYTSKNSSIRTFSSEGWLDYDSMKKFKEEIKKSFSKKGNLFWDTVISLRDYEDSFQSGMKDVNDYAAIVSKVLPGYFKSIGLDPDNMLWWMNYHNNKKNPHMHIVFMEKIQTRTKGKLRQDAVNKYKSVWLKEFGLRQEFSKKFNENHIDAFKQKDLYRKSLLEKINQNINERNLTTLYSMLPKEGRLSYNSKPIAPFKKYIDEITTSILNEKEVKEEYIKWLDKVNMLDQFQNELAGDTISHLKDTEIKKLYSRIGNMILQHKKYIEVNREENYDLWFQKYCILKKNEEHTFVKLMRKNAVIELPSDKIFADKNNINHFEIISDKEYNIHVFDRIIDAWKMQSQKYEYKLSGEELVKFIKHNSSEINQVITNDKQSDSGKDELIIKGQEDNGNETNLEKSDISKKSQKRQSMNIHSNNQYGIKKVSRNFHQTAAIYAIRKGALRALSQDAREKESDLAKFIQEYEKQQIRSRGGEVEYYDS